MRLTEVALSLVTCAVLTWTVLDAPVFIARSSDRTIKFFLVLIVAFTLIGIGIKLHCSVRPMPNQQIQTYLKATYTLIGVPSGYGRGAIF